MKAMELDYQRALDEIHEGGNVQTKIGNSYTPDILKTVIELIGEAEVPTGRCGRII
jgi:hypothetical protein